MASRSAQWAKDAAANLVQADILPAMKQALGRCATGYAAGVIPVDFFTLADADAMNKVTGGNQAGLVYAPAWATQYGVDTSKKNDRRPCGRGRRSRPAGRLARKLGELPYHVINGFRSGFANVGHHQILQLVGGVVGKSVRTGCTAGRLPNDRRHRRLPVDRRRDLAGGPDESSRSQPSFGPHWDRGGTYMDTYADAHTNALTESWKTIPADKQDAMQTFLLNDPMAYPRAYRQAYAYTTGHDKEDDIFDQYTGLPTPACSLRRRRWMGCAPRPSMPSSGRQTARLRLTTLCGVEERRRRPRSRRKSTIGCRSNSAPMWGRSRSLRAGRRTPRLHTRAETQRTGLAGAERQRHAPGSAASRPRSPTSRANRMVTDDIRLSGRTASQVKLQ
jgi:hypothetical protein